MRTASLVVGLVSTTAALGGVTGARADDGVAETPWAVSEVRQGVGGGPVPELTFTGARFSWRADAQAGVTGQGATMGGVRSGAGTGEASVGAELAISNEGCDVLVLGGQVDVRSDRDDVAVQQWGELCPISGVFTLRLDHRLEWAVTPRLLAPPRLRAEGTWRETFGMGYAVRVGTGLAADGTRYALEVADVRMAPTLSWVPGHAELFDIGVVADLSFLRFVIAPADGSRRDVRLIEGRIEAAPMASGLLAMTFDLDLVRAEGWRAAGVTWGAALGVGDASLQAPAASPPGAPMQPAGTRVYDYVDAIAGTFALHGERNLGSLVARVDVDRALWPTYDGRAVIEDRVTASVRGERDRWRGRLDAVAARTRVLTLDGLTSAPRGGVSVDVEHALGAHLVARGHVEVAKSVYASGGSFAAPAWGAEASVSIGVHAGNR